MKVQPGGVDVRMVMMTVMVIISQCANKSPLCATCKHARKSGDDELDSLWLCSESRGRRRDNLNARVAFTR